MMHFWGLKRLTDLERDSIVEASTVRLSGLYLEAQTNLERAASRGRIMRWVLRHTRGLANCKDRLVSISQELQNRYEGVLGQMVERGGETTERAKRIGRQRVWGEWLAEIRSVGDPRDVSPTIWRSLFRLYGNTAIALKEKLMLRQFVDSLPAQLRRSIVAGAFGRKIMAPSTAEEIQYWGKGCGFLDYVMTGHGSDLERMTDSCISERLLAASRDIRYRWFLFWLYYA